MRKTILCLFVLLCTCQLTWAQKQAVRGVVTSTDDGLGVIGASVLEKGTSNGTITDFDGAYTLQVEPGATLVVSYVGMKTTEIVVTGEKHDVVLSSDATIIEEVVVTAMGVKQEKKRLNFAVQSVGSEAITDSKSSNFVNSLQGRVAGVSVTTAGGSPNGGSNIILRAPSSINGSQNNQPLFVLDGMPITGGGNTAGDINPNDIENVTVLKGAAASALYGQDGANGVIMITTKQAAEGKLQVTANAGVQVDLPTRLPDLQSTYGPGALGFHKELTGGGWGPMLNEDDKVYDNVGNFFKTGLYHKYDVSMRGGTEKFQGYASANFSRNDGIVPNDFLQRIGVMLKGTYNISKKLSVSMMANITNDRSRGAGDIRSVYSWPINDDITDYKNPDGSVRFRYLSEKKEESPVSPLWSRYEDFGLSNRTRNMLMGSFEWKAFRNFKLIGRLSYDQSSSESDSYTVPRFNDNVLLAESDPTQPYFTEEELASVNKDLLGVYSYYSSRSSYLTGTYMANYLIELPKDFSIELMLGGELRMQNSTGSSMMGRDFNIPGVYSMSNVNEILGTNDIGLNHSQRRIYGFFGEARFDYKGLASLSVTGRRDRSSTVNNPFFYPSVTGGLIFSELFDISNDWFSYGKLRGNWAKVGKDATPYLYDRKFKQYSTFPDKGYGVDPTSSVADRNLTPEMSSSWEIGLDLRFFDSKTRFDVAYYRTEVENQIVTVRVSPAAGYILQTRNEGWIRNEGVEFTFDQDLIKKRNVMWTMGLNFSLNRGKVVSLPDGLTELQGTQYGDMFPTAYCGGSTTAISGKDYMRTEDGQIICDDKGYPIINPSKSVMIGNREPKFMAGLHTNFQYKGFAVSALLEGRLGGDVANVTGRSLVSSGQHKMLEEYRGRQVVVEGVVEQEDGTFVENRTPIVLDYTTLMSKFQAVSSNFIEDGSYIRLSFVSLSYDFSSMLKGKAVHGVKCSLTGNNLFTLTKYTGTSPSVNADTSKGGTGSMGIDNFPVPNTLGVNFSVNLSF